MVLPSLYLSLSLNNLILYVAESAEAFCTCYRGHWGKQKGYDKVTP